MQESLVSENNLVFFSLNYAILTYVSEKFLMKLQIKPLITSVSLVIIIVLVIFLVKSKINTDSGTRIIFSDNNDTAQNNNDNQTDNGFSPTSIPLPEGKTRKLILYLDDNQNLTKDDKEKACGRCIDSVVVVTASDYMPNNLARDNVALVSKGGSVDFINPDLAKNIWGYLPDKNLLIPFTIFDTSASPAYAPTMKVYPAIGGINANIQSTSIEDTGDALITTYRIVDFVPLMKSYSEKGSKVWVQFTPRSKSPNQYYLAEGKLTVDPTLTDGQIETRWDLIEIPEDFDDTAKIKIIIPEF